MEGYSESCKTFLFLLRLGLWADCKHLQDKGNENLSKHSEYFWQEVIDLAVKQAVCGIVFEGCLSMGKEGAIPKSILFKLVSLHLQAKERNIHINKTLQTCVAILNKANIKYALLKGQGLAQYYNNPYSRQCGDIDLFVGKKQADAYDTFRSQFVIESVENDGKHISFQLNGNEIELHAKVDMMPNRLKSNSFWKWSEEELFHNVHEITIDKVQINTPAPTYNAFYVFYHLYRHFMSSGIGLRQFCDWARLLYSQYDLIDKEVIEAKLNEFGLIQGWDVMMTVLLEYLGLPESRAILFSHRDKVRSDKVFQMVLDEGNFGFYGTVRGRPKEKWAGKWFYFKRVSKRNIKLLRILPRNTIEYYLSYLIYGIKDTLKKLNK